MEVDKSTKILDWEAIKLAKSKMLAKGLASDGPIIFYDDFVTLGHVNYQTYSRNLLLQCVSIKGKTIIDTWRSDIEIKISNLSEVMELHRAAGEALSYTVDDQENIIVG